MQSAGGPQFNGRGVMVQVMQSSGTPLQRPKPRLHVPNQFKLNRIKSRLHARA